MITTDSNEKTVNDIQKQTTSSKLQTDTNTSKPKDNTTKFEVLEPEPVFTSVTDTLANWEITVTDYNYVDSVSSGLLTEYRASDGSKYCVIDITAKNTGEKASTFLPVFIVDNQDSYAKLEWGDYEYTRSILDLAKENLLQEQLNPLVSANGQLFFEVPKEMEDSDDIPALIIRQGKNTFKCELKKELK